MAGDHCLRYDRLLSDRASATAGVFSADPARVDIAVAFPVAEIDIPGKRIVRVAPDDLVHVAFTLPLINGANHDPTHSFYHAH